MDDRNDRIRQRAYEIWEKEGRPEGRHHDHWERAEGEMGRDDLPRPGGVPSGEERLDTPAERAREAVADTTPEGEGGHVQAPGGLGTGIGTTVARDAAINSPTPGYGENLDLNPDDRRDAG